MAVALRETVYRGDRTHRGLRGDRRERLRRLAAHIARRPGQARKDLARAFCFSERQIQADLALLRGDEAPSIRAEVRLRLSRRGGYRYEVAEVLRLWVDGDEA